MTLGVLESTHSPCEETHEETKRSLCVRQERWQEPDGCSVDTQKAAHAIDVFSGGTQPGDSLNEESRKSVEAVGASFDGEYPKPIDPDLLRSVDRVVIVGGSAQVDQVEGMRGSIETWDITEPSLRGIEVTLVEWTPY